MGLSKLATVTNSNVYPFTGASSPATLNSMVTLFLLQLQDSRKTKLKSHIQSYLSSFSCIKKAIKIVYINTCNNLLQVKSLGTFCLPETVFYFSITHMSLVASGVF